MWRMDSIRCTENRHRWGKKMDNSEKQSLENSPTTEEIIERIERLEKKLAEDRKSVHKVGERND